jgi:hypothetical protein
MPPPEILCLLASAAVWCWFFYRLIRSLKHDCEHSPAPRRLDSKAMDELKAEVDRRQAG